MSVSSYKGLMTKLSDDTHNLVLTFKMPNSVLLEKPDSTRRHVPVDNNKRNTKNYGSC